MRFGFPDKNPEDWKLLREVIKPFPKKSIDSSNVKVLLPWFDKLLIDRGLEACDSYYSKEVLPYFFTGKYNYLALTDQNSKVLSDSTISCRSSKFLP